MSKDYKDRILDACLEETLGGMAPPDVAGRVVAAFTDESPNGSGNGSPRTRRGVQDLLPPSALTSTSPNGEEPPVHKDLVPSRTARPAQTASWSHVTLAMTLLAVACGVSYAFYRLAKVNAPANDLAEQNSTLSDDSALPPARPENALDRERAPQQSPKRPAQLADRNPRQTQDKVVTPPARPDLPITPETTPDKRAIANTTPDLPAPLSDHEIVAKIDATLVSAWAAAGIESVTDASAREWCLRAYSRLIGRSPEESELQEFTANPSAEKRNQLVDQLVSSPEFASHWGGLLTNAFVGTNTKQVADRDALSALLSDTLSRDTPYNEVAFSLLTATGSNNAQQENYNPATNYLVAHAGKDTLEATAQVSRHFLGQRARCVQCHDSMIGGNDWQQQRFWGLDSFLRQMLVQSNPQAGGVVITDRDFRGEGKTPEEAEVYFSKMNGVLEVAFPQFIDGTQINASGFVTDVNRRQEFAKLLVASTAFRESTANRIWAELLGVGFTTPVDDMGPHNPPVHPGLLKDLGEQFAAHNFQLKAFVTWVAKSKAFGLKTSQSPNTTTNAQLFATYTPPRQASTSLEQSLALFAKARSGSQLTEQDQQQIGRLVQPTKPATGTTQLQIIDGDMAFLDELGPMQATIADEDFDSVTRRVVYGSMSPQKKIEHLFQYRLGRHPSRRELQHASKLLGEEDSDSGFRVLSWTLRNTPESR